MDTKHDTDMTIPLQDNTHLGMVFVYLTTHMSTIK